jgi:hypothetical protein
MSLDLERPDQLEFDVCGQPLAVQLRDESVVHLLPVFEHGAPSRYHRAVRTGAVTRVVDVRRLARQLGVDLGIAAARDVPGLVHFTLRLTYPTAALLLDDIERHGTRLPSPKGATQ